MADNKLNLMVQFLGVDKLSGPLRNIMSGAKGGSKSIIGLRREVRDMERDLARVNRELAKGNSTNGGLFMAQRELSEAIRRTNDQIDLQQKKLDRVAAVKSGAGKVASVAGTAGAAMTAGVSAPLMLFAASSIQASRDAAAAVAQVQASLASMGPVAGRSLEQLKTQATNLMNTSLFDDDEILKSVTANLLTFGKVTGPTFDRAQQAAVNMSAKLGTDLQGSTLQVGKALNDPIKGVTALSRAGVSFTATQKEMIKSMAEAGNVAGAQNIILGEMEKQFGGSAAAARKADPTGALAISFGELKQSIGDKLLPVLTPFVQKLTELVDGFGNLSPGMQNTIIIVGGLLAVAGPLLIGIAGIASVVSMAAAALPILGGALALLFSPIGLVVAAVGLLGYAIYSNWDKIKAAFAAGVSWVKEKLGAVGAWMSNVGSMIMSGLVNALNPALLVNKLVSIAKAGITAFKNFFGIKSPSRLFMQMGGHMTAGLAMGIDRTGRAPLRAMGRMAAGVAGAGALSLASAGGASAAGATAAAPVTINVYQQPGEDAQALADRIGRLLEAKNRTRRLSSFADDF